MKISFEGTMDEFHEFAEKIVHLRRLEKRRARAASPGVRAATRILREKGRAGFISAIKAYRDATRNLATGEVASLKDSKDVVDALYAKMQAKQAQTA